MRKYLLPENSNSYKANLHTHSNFSDGGMSPEEIKEYYVEHYGKRRIYNSLKRKCLRFIASANIICAYRMQIRSANIKEHEPYISVVYAEYSEYLHQCRYWNKSTHKNENCAVEGFRAGLPTSLKRKAEKSVADSKHSNRYYQICRLRKNIRNTELLCRNQRRIQRHK